MNTFDPSSIEQYAVIKFPYDFGPNIGRRTKLFVALGHVNNNVVCIKATSQVDLCLNNKEVKAGCVYYAAGESGCFMNDTAIEPANQFPISYEHIRACRENRIFESLGTLPDDFEEALMSAIENSFTMTDRQKKRIVRLLAGTI